VRKVGDFYLAVSEINGDQRSPFGRVNILNKDMSGGRSFVTNGTSPCHIGIAKDEDIFGVANYNGGTAAFFSLKPELDEIFPKVFQFQCDKSDHPRQDASHMHSVMFNPDGVHIAAADLGCDTIRIFKWQNKELTYHPELSFRTEKHCGPRHTDWSNDGKYLAVSCELSSQISIYEFSPSGSKLVSILSTLPEGYTEDNTVSDIHFHPSNQFVYTANRGHNSIAAYKIANDGKLTSIGQYETKGKIPRNFMITKNGKYLLAANQSSDNITIFTISEDGTLKYLSQVPQETPVCLEEI
jgi:6-phosphogluconolactonase